MRKNEEEQGRVFLQYGKAVVLGGVIALASALGFLFLAAIGISHGLLDGGLLYQLTVVSYVLGGFIGGLFAVRRCPSKGLFVGLAAGGALFFLQLTLGLLFFDAPTLEGGGWGFLFGALCGGAAAGILGGGGKRKPTSRTRKKRRGK